MCRRIIDVSYEFGRNYPNLCHAEAEEMVPMVRRVCRETTPVVDVIGIVCVCVCAYVCV